MIVLAVLAVVVLVAGGWVVSNYNRLVSQKTEVERGFAEVDNLLLRRNDLIPNLVETVKGVAAQEQAVFGAIADARAQMAGARTADQKLEAGRAMDGALGRLLVVIENYPQLKSQENFLRLQDELAGTENRLSVARTRYNENVRDYNLLVRRVPTNLFAGLFGYQEQPYYPVGEAQKQVPAVRFPAAPGAQQAAPEPAPAGGGTN
jgi:LemA protein